MQCSAVLQKPHPWAAALIHIGGPLAETRVGHNVLGILISRKDPTARERAEKLVDGLSICKINGTCTSPALAVSGRDN